MNKERLVNIVRINLTICIIALWCIDSVKLHDALIESNQIISIFVKIQGYNVDNDRRVEMKTEVYTK